MHSNTVANAVRLRPSGVWMVNNIMRLVVASMMEASAMPISNCSDNKTLLAAVTD